MKVKALIWMGIKTEKFQEMEHFWQNIMGCSPINASQDRLLFQLPNKDMIEIFGPLGPNQHFTPDAIVCGFQVEDIFQARQELVQAGIELIGPVQETRPGGFAYQHFRGPDGNLYALATDPEQI